jgi:hypothetical protein
MDNSFIKFQFLHLFFLTISSDLIAMYVIIFDWRENNLKGMKPKMVFIGRVSKNGV